MDHHTTFMPAKDNASIGPDSPAQTFNMRIMIISIQGAFAGLGLILNVLLLILLAVDSRLRKPLMAAVSSLALANIIYAGGLTPIDLYRTLRDDLPFNAYTCRALSIFTFSVPMVKALHVVLITTIPLIQNSLAVMSGGLRKTSINIIICCVLVWVLGFIINIPITVYQLITTDTNSSMVCVVDDMVYMQMVRVGVFGVYVLIHSVIFLIMGCAAKKTVYYYSDEERPISHMLIPIVIFFMFFISYIPLNILLLLMDLPMLRMENYLGDSLGSSLRIGLDLLMMAELFLVPLLLLALPTPYQYALRSCLCKGSSSNDEYGVSNEHKFSKHIDSDSPETYPLKADED